MIPYLRIVILIVLFQNIANSSGKIITAIDTSGKGMRGELLTLRADEIILSLKPGASEKALQENPMLLIRVPKESIRGIEIEGHSHVGEGIALGATFGLMSGIVIGSSSTHETHTIGDIFQPVETAANTLACGVIGLIGGGLIGGIIGDASSNNYEYIDLSNPRVYGTLHRFVRYQGDEPQFLKNIK